MAEEEKQERENERKGRKFLEKERNSKKNLPKGEISKKGVKFFENLLGNMEKSPSLVKS